MKSDKTAEVGAGEHQPADTDRRHPQNPEGPPQYSAEPPEAFKHGNPANDNDRQGGSGAANDVDRQEGGETALLVSSDVPREQEMRMSKIKINYSERPSEFQSQVDTGSFIRGTFKDSTANFRSVHSQQPQSAADQGANVYQEVAAFGEEDLLEGKDKKEDDPNTNLDHEALDFGKEKPLKGREARRNDEDKAMSTQEDEDSASQADGAAEATGPKLFEGTKPLERAWWLQKVFFTWVTPLMTFAQKHRELKIENYGDIREKDGVHQQMNKLRRVWKAQTANGASKNALMITIFKAYKWNLVYIMACNFCSILLMFLQPFFLFYIIGYIKDGQNRVHDWGVHFYDFSEIPQMRWLTREKQYGLSLGLCLLASQFFKAVIDENVWYATFIVGAHSSNGLVGLIYEKQTRIYSSNGSGFTNGQIINFVQTDANKLFSFIQALALVANVPFILVVSIGLLFYFLGWSFFAGLFVFAVSFYVNQKLASVSAGYQKPYMAKQDKRVGLTTEALNNIKMVKLYSWTNTIEEQIKQRRQEEILIYRKRIFIGMLVTACLQFFPASLQAVCYAFFIGFGGQLELNVGYMVLNIFNMISEPIRSLPLFIGGTIEFSISMRRVQEFLLLGEINETIVDKSAIIAASDDLPPQPSLHIRSQQEISVEITEGSNFYWGLKKDDSDSDKKEEHKKTLQDRKEAKKAEKREKKDRQKKRKKTAADRGGRQPLLAEEEIQGGDDSPDDKSEKEVKVKDVLCLKDIGIKVCKGEFVCVIGDVGSGKSSLLQSILGELQYLDREFVNEFGECKLIDKNVRRNVQIRSDKKLEVAPIKLNESVSFVQQVPWIQNKTIRENIVFGEEFDAQKYRNTIKICELARDLEILPAGDETEIGEKGINLSGGQKARVGLARAIYANKDLILMDDPISALDANVKKSIFEKVMLEHLKYKTRILVTHAVDFLSLVDRVVVMKEGQIILQGAFEDIKDNDYLKQLLEIHKAHQNEQQEIGEQAEELQVKQTNADEALDDQIPANTDARPMVFPAGTSNLEVSMRSQQELLSISQGSDHDMKKKKKDSKMKSEKGKIMTNEDDEKIVVSVASYLAYFGKFYGGFTFFFLSFFSMILWLLSKMAADYVVGNWASQPDQQSRFGFYCGLSLAFAFLQGLFIYFREACIQLFGWSATRKLHERMMHRVLRAPVNLYFDTTPIGRILNKFTKDLNAVESGFAYVLGVIYITTFTLLYCLVLAVISCYWMALIIPFMLLVSWILIRKTKMGLKEGVRLTSTARSPLVSYLGETISGSTTIRAYDKVEQFIEGNKIFLNNNILAIQSQSAICAWFGIRVNVFSLSIMLMFTLVVVIARKDDGSNSIILSMLMTSVLTINGTLVNLLQYWMYLESQMVNVVRCMKLLEVPVEKQLPNEVGVSKLLQGRPNWPEQGLLEFKNVSLKYRPTTEIVLSNLSFKVESGEKIGVVGRTGAGKSTICLALSRIVELFEGQIFIDGVDIAKIKLEDLRARVTVIPQDPTMFTGTLRFNLDPENQHADEEILDLMHKGQLQTLVNSSPEGINQEITENGQNLSSGERQLICICRAILRKSKLVILDEATANIDVITEQKIQTLIDTQFVDATMVTIAHRINTIIQSDRVLVLSFGRIKEFDSPSNLMADRDSEFSKLIQELKQEEAEADA